MGIPLNSRRPKISTLKRSVLLVGAFVVLLVGGWLAYRWFGRTAGRSTFIYRYLRDQQTHTDWAIHAGERCGDAPFVMPTNGIIGYLWGDSFRPGHSHQGLDIFGSTTLGEIPVVAAYDGYLTRNPDWRSAVIMRHPEDPFSPSRQIWTYYAHMADPEGNSYISEAFPPGTTEVFVEAGTLLGYQGNYSGYPDSPTGIHLHFSIVLDDGYGNYRNELEIRNTLDPLPYLGFDPSASYEGGALVLCEP
jgi:murein DD-endopeptidase MepM/ murein hydrolase activator NlpD